MQTIEVDSIWIFARGGLHDAHVVAAAVKGKDVELRIDDQWANERGLGKPKGVKNPIFLLFQSVDIFEGSIEGSVGGWISDFVFEEDRSYSVIFADREMLKIRSQILKCIDPDL